MPFHPFRLCQKGLRCKNFTLRNPYALSLTRNRSTTRLIHSQLHPHREQPIKNWKTRPNVENILLVQKPQDARVADALQRVIKHVKETYPEVTLFHEPSSSKQPIPPETEVYDPSVSDTPIDLVITLGGDGTILHASSLFSRGPVPPVLSFSLGTLGFLLPFHIDSLKTALANVFAGRTTVLPRMRLSCTLWSHDGVEKSSGGNSGWEVMNEVALHRGRSPHLASIDAYVDGQHLTAAISDGLILSTPTGSTAYSLSSGGPIVHPSVRAILLTPVAPMSLSFRPLVLPGWSKVHLKVNPSSRTSAYISMDGREAGVLNPGDYLEVHASEHPIPCINRLPADAPTSDPVQSGQDHDGDTTAVKGVKRDNWVRDINTLLGFNVSFKANGGMR